MLPRQEQGRNDMKKPLGRDAEGPDDKDAMEEESARFLVPLFPWPRTLTAGPFV